MFNIEIFNLILIDVMCGKAVLDILPRDPKKRTEGYPAHSTFYTWLLDDKIDDEFKIREKYELAIQIKCATHFDELITMSDALFYRENEKGELIHNMPDSAQVSALRECKDARKFVISRLLPRKYGELTQKIADLNESTETKPAKVVRLYPDPVETASAGADLSGRSDV